MPRIDPQQLLVCLTPLLAQNGGIKSPGEVIRLANLMEKYSKKLVSKCIYIQILKCTETDLLGQFMAAGGWNLVHNWLRDGGDSNNWAFIQELLEMLLLCPVDGNRLKSNHTPKIVKNLSLSCPHNTVRILSSKLVEQWLKIAHQEKQQLTATQTNGINGTDTGLALDVNNKLVNDNKVCEALQQNENNNVQVNEKQSKENVKYKVSNKEGSGKLLISLKRSTSPSVDEKDSNLSRSSSLESKSKSSSSTTTTTTTTDKDKQKKSSSSSHKSSSSSSKSSHRDKDRSSSSSSHHKSSSRDKSKDSSSKSSSSKRSTSSSSSRDKDKDKDKDRRKKDTEKSQAEKDKETLNQLAPLSSSKLQRIPKRQHSDNSENKSSELNKDPTDASPSKVAKTAEPVEKKKPSISIEVRKGEKPKTVKTINSQFRNHGLAEEPPKPPSRRDLKKPITAAPLILLPTLPSAASLVKTPTSTSPPPIKKLHLDKVLDLENVPERVGGIKLIKPKPMLVESIGFMDALSASTVNKKDPKKRKRLPSNSKKDEPESPKIEAKPLKFYKDTFEESEEQTNGEKSPTKELETSPDDGEVKTEDKEVDDKSPELADSSEKSSNVEGKEDIAEIEELEEKRGPGIGCGPDGPPGVLVHPNIPRRKKRKIRWRSNEELTEIRYFELDETERTNVSKTFTEQKQMEHVEERSAFKLGRKAQSDDTMAEQTTWRALIIVDNVPEINYGYKSREAEIQAEREKNVLQELYFRHSINDSPHEPDPESYEHEEPQIVPQEDVTGNPDSINIFTDIQWPAPKGDLPSTFSSNAFANVFTHINIPPALGIPQSSILGNSIANPLASFNLAGMPGQLSRDAPNPIMNQWMIPPASFLQPPPAMIGPQSGFGNRGGANNMNNNYRSNNSRPHSNNNNNNNGGGGNWVRGNARPGICNQFRKHGVCRNKSCPYIHER